MGRKSTLSPQRQEVLKAAMRAARASAERVESAKRYVQNAQADLDKHEAELVRHRRTVASLQESCKHVVEEVAATFDGDNLEFVSEHCKVKRCKACFKEFP